MKQQITIETHIDAPIEKIWKYWTDPQYIVKWNNASPDWHTPRATNDLRVGGTFMSRMESKDGKTGFDFTGTYTTVDLYKKIEYVMPGDDARKVSTTFTKEKNGYTITTTFDAENENSLDMQRGGWQAILDNFKKCVLEN